MIQDPATVKKAETRQEIQDAVRDIRESVRQQVAAAKNEAATAQGENVPGAPMPPVPPRGPGGGITVIQAPGHPFGAGNEIPQQAVDMAIVFFALFAAVIVFLPITRAWARRIDRKAVAQVPPEVTAHLSQLNQAVDAIALEVERISEGQRFTTRLLSEQRAEAERAPLLPGAEKRATL